MQGLVKVSLYNTDTGENIINHLPVTESNLDFLRNTSVQMERTLTQSGSPDATVYRNTKQTTKASTNVTGVGSPNAGCEAHFNTDTKMVRGAPQYVSDSLTSSEAVGAPYRGALNSRDRSLLPATKPSPGFVWTKNPISFRTNELPKSAFNSSYTRRKGDRKGFRSGKRVNRLRTKHFYR